MSSYLSSPPSTFEFDVVGESIRKSIRLSPTMEDKLNLALTYANVYRRYEHHTVRYVMMLLQIIFFDEKFNIVP